MTWRSVGAFIRLNGASFLVWLASHLSLFLMAKHLSVMSPLGILLRFPWGLKRPKKDARGCPFLPSKRTL